MGAQENIEIEEEIILSQEDQAGPHYTEAEIARQFNINWLWNSVPYNWSRNWSLFPQETQGAKTYWFEHWKAHALLKKRTVTVYSENIRNCIL